MSRCPVHLTASKGRFRQSTRQKFKSSENTQFGGCTTLSQRRRLLTLAELGDRIDSVRKGYGPMAHVIRQPCDEGVIRSKEAQSVCTPNAAPWVLAATILGSSMAFIDETALPVALPAIQSGLDATAVDAQWVVAAYTLFLAALVLVGGSLGDHLGRRRMFSVGVVLFALASTWCGLSQSPEQLILARALQGVGAALLVPNSLAIIGASFEEERRGKAIGTWTSLTSVTLILGPLLGGYFAENISWRWVFFINVPIAIAVLAIARWRVPESHDPEARRLDVPG